MAMTTTPQRRYCLRGVPVAFPYEPYPCQLLYMERVIEALQNGQNALLESPTGSGKTLCLLCATLAWRAALSGPVTDPGAGRADIPLIVYASRTHSQLQQALRQLKMTEYRPRVSIVASRDSLCVHPKLGAGQYVGQALNQQCQVLCAARRCMYSNHLDEFEKGNPGLIDHVYDLEDLAYIGRQHEVCAYYLAMDGARHADFLFVPYNYLVEPALRKTLQLDARLQGAVVIFDEAHNIESSCMDSSSFDLTALDLAQSILDADYCMNAAAAPNWVAPAGVTLEATHIVTAALTLKERLLSLEAAIANHEMPSDRTKGITLDGTYIETFLKRVGIDTSDLRLLDTLAQVCTARTESDPALRRLRDRLLIVQRALASNSAAYYRVHIHEAEARPVARKGFSRAAATEGRTLSFWCFSSGVTMKEFVGLGAHALLLTSGTLAPLPALRAELEVAFPIALENEHVIGGDQILVGLLPVGPSGVRLNSTFGNRARPEYVTELGNALEEMARIIPDGLLVFFPSYPALQAALDGWRLSPILGRLEAYKAVVVEPRQSGDLKACLTTYRDAIDAGRGAILLAVCRGKVSEGVDFSDRAARGVVICGLPFASTQAPRVRLKRQYLERTTRDPRAGQQWYTMQAWRAVNQAVGRVIRHRHDYGAIVLADERFGRDSATHLSLWLRRHVKPLGGNFAEGAAHLAQFYSRCAAAATARGAPPLVSTAITEPDRDSDPRFADLHPIAALYQKFRRLHGEASTMPAASAIKDRAGPARPLRVRSEDWGQGGRIDPSVQNVRVPRSEEVASIEMYAAPVKQSTPIPEAATREPAAEKDALRVRMHETGQALLDLIKTNCSADHYGEFRTTLRQVLLAKRSPDTDTDPILTRLLAQLRSVTDSERLRLCERFTEFLPARFVPAFNRLRKAEVYRAFAAAIRDHGAETHSAFLALVKALRSCYQGICAAAAAASGPTGTPRAWTADESVEVRSHCCRLIQFLVRLGRAYPARFQIFVYQDLQAMYGECLEVELADWDRRPITERVKAPDTPNRACQFCAASDARVPTRSSTCGHIGCWDCWQAHLRRSKTCPCNEPTASARLERLLF